ncbi:hypothetical protein Ccrd_004348 [Cynara cardunculus var. scolymus]|uniref:Uncharacterized protein n=1 Tax=Cynara cardunculus var. scolymus TaxID=59895 RepID=A0A103XMN1_CYNCS|nr:hypothetical protein Ccrd_004348 [Cynara cardunculus var. scolymus]
MVLHEEAECIERCPSVERCNVSEDAKKYHVERATRRELKLGDHLRSPFVIRAVDLNVTPEDRKIHEWAVAGLGGNELLFSTPKDTKLHRHAIESLGHTTTIYDLLSSAKNNWEVVQMRNEDLNPSIVVIDNRHREVSDDDHLLQMYDFITDILTGLTPESKTQENQIANLRVKYVAKILMNSYNVKKDYVIKEVEKFNSIDEVVRAKIRKRAHDTRVNARMLLIDEPRFISTKQRFLTY